MTDPTIVTRTINDAADAARYPHETGARLVESSYNMKRPGQRANAVIPGLTT